MLVTACALCVAAAPGSASAALPPIKHVWIVVLENKDFNTTFGPGSKAPYLADSLTARGALLRNYYGIGHVSLDNYIAMVSGQGPNAATKGDCDTNTTLGNPAGAGGGSVDPSPTTWQFDADGLDDDGRRCGR